jgi:ABC-2 type transport system permease protein
MANMFAKLFLHIYHYKILQSLRFKKILAFKKSLVILSVSMILNNLFFFGIWFLLLNRFGSINGYGLQEFVLIAGLSAFSYSIMFWLFGNIVNLGQYLADDSFLENQLYPVSTLIVFLNRGGSASLVGDFIQGLACLLIYLVLNPSSFGWLIVAILMIVSGSFGLLMIVSSISFFVNVRTLTDVFISLLIGSSSYPATSFSGLSKWVIVGTGIWFINFIPIERVRGANNPQDLISSILVILAVNLLGLWLWKQGLKRAESGGGMGVVRAD